MKTIRRRWLALLLVCGMGLLCPAALAAERVDVPELGLELEAPEGTVYFTRSNIDETMSLVLFGMDGEELSRYLSETGAYLDLVAANRSYEVLLYADPAEGELPLSQWSEEEQTALVAEYLDDEDYAACDLLDVGDIKLLRLSELKEAGRENGLAEAIYYTVANEVTLLVYVYPMEDVLPERALPVVLSETETLLGTLRWPGAPVAWEGGDTFDYDFTDEWNAMPWVVGAAIGMALLLVIPALILRRAHRRAYPLPAAIGLGLAVGAAVLALFRGPLAWLYEFTDPSFFVCWLVVAIVILWRGRSKRPEREAEKYSRWADEEDIAREWDETEGRELTPWEQRELNRHFPVAGTGTPKPEKRGVVRPSRAQITNRRPSAAEYDPCTHRPSVKRCPDCGKRVSAHARVCPRCGSEVYYYHAEEED